MEIEEDKVLKVCDNCGKDIHHKVYWFWSHPICKRCFWYKGSELANRWRDEARFGIWKEGNITTYMDLEGGEKDGKEFIASLQN